MCDTVRDEYLGNVIVWYVIAVYMMFACVMIFEVMVVLGLPPSELMQCMRPPSELVHGGVQ